VGGGKRQDLTPKPFSHNTRAQFKKVFDALRELMTPPDPPKRPIGFINPEDKGSKKTSGTKRQG
jgi:hypothetical protein